MNTAACLVKLLSCYDVDCVFGIPGVHTLELYRGLEDSAMRVLTPRHEQAAGFMADGYARSTGKPGICFIISGPGMTNILTAMAQAWADSIPMLVVSSVNAHGRMGSGDGWLHELPDQQALVRGVCEFSHTLHSPAELPSVLARAFAVFDSGRARPVHIEIPINVLAMAMPDAIAKSTAVGPTITRLRKPVGSESDLILAASLLRSAHKPLMLVGGGARQAHAFVASVAEKLDAPVVMTVNGRGILPGSHPLAVSASASTLAVRQLISDSDVVVAVGTEFGSTDYDFNEDDGFAIPGTLIRIDIDAQQIMRTRIPELGIVGDAHATLQLLLPMLGDASASLYGMRRVTNCLNEVQQSLSSRYAQYIAMLNTIATTFSTHPIIVGDSTQIIYAGNSAFASAVPGTYFNSATGYGTLGYALPAAIGAAVGTGAQLPTTASSDVPAIIAIIGDGGLQFTAGELSSAIDAQVNLILIVHENGGYDEIRQFMSGQGIQPVGVELHVPDIMLQATACGWHASRLTAMNDLGNQLTIAAGNNQPTLLLITDDLFDD